MKFYGFIKFSSIAIILFLFFSCGNEKSKTKQKSDVITDLITSYPKGKISSLSEITVTFRKPIQVKSKNLKGIFEFSPRAEGKTYRSGEKSITFQPDKPFGYNQEYKVTVNLDKIFENPPEDAFVFNIKTLPLTVAADMLKISPVNIENTKINKGKVTLRFSETIDDKSLKKAITIKQNDSELPFSIEDAHPSDVFSITVDSIIRHDEPSKIVLTLDMKKLSAEGERNWTFPVNSLKEFDFLDWELIPGKDKVISLYFSDPIDENQNLNGLIYFNDNTAFNYKIDKNIVKLYLQGVQDGSKTLIVSQSLKNIKNIKLKQKVKIDVYFRPVKPQAQFINSGTVVTGEKNLSVPFKTINLNAIDVVVFKIYRNNIKQFLQANNINGMWELNRVGDFVYHEKIILHKNPQDQPNNKWENYSLDISKMVNTDPGSIYRIYLKFKKEYAMLSCVDTDEKQISSNDKNEENYLYGNYYYPPDYSWTESEYPCKNSYYYHNRFPGKNIFTTDIGLTAKKLNGNEYEVFVNNLITANPVKDAKIELFDFQQQSMASGSTGEDGFFKAVCNKDVAFVTAQKDNSYAYLKTLGGNALSLSKFDTKGVKAENGVKGFIYGERGVWRPGDTLFLNFILQDKRNSIPEGHPFVINVFDAQNRQVYTKTAYVGHASVYSFAVPTDKDDPTGIWYAEIKLGGNTFNKRLRVENIKPNRLKIEINTGDNNVVTGKNKFAVIKAQWLSGGTASGLKARVNESITTGRAKFKKYKNYIFDDPSKRFYPDETTVFDDKLDETGKAEFEISMPQGKYLPSMLNLNFVAKVFEPGGGFSIEQKQVKYAPFNRYVGIETPATGDNEWLETDKNNIFNLVLITADGKPVNSGKLQVEVYKLDWSWWYRNDDEPAAYVSRDYRQRIINKTVRVRNGKAKFKLLIKYPEWGRFFVRVIDKASGNSAGTTVYVDWPSSYSRGNRKALSDATLLNITAGKKKYMVGETVKVSFPAPENGKILVSIEKNNRQIKWWWSDNVSDDEKVLEFTATKEMTPNVYVCVSVLQPHGQTANDLPLRLYGVIPVFVEDPGTKLLPQIEVPANIRPESDYTIKISEKNGKAAEYTIAVVDEGLLSLTHFKTPDPYGYFYSKEALAVKTWDMYDDVAGAFAGRLLQQFAVGGDEELAALGKKSANRFKPVVKFLGPFKLNKGETAVHNLKMDNYTGAVRVMIVAANKSAYGKAEKTVTVKQPLMVLATLPRVLAPGEKIKLPVTVFNTEKNIHTVKVSVTVNNLFSLEQKVKTVEFDKPGDKTIFFDMLTGNAQGTGTVNVKVTASHEEANYQISVDVRNPNKRQYKVSNYRLTPGKSLKESPEYLGMPESRQLKITASLLPPVNLEKRLRFLIKYPYGCIEQTVSSVFPQLFLNKLVMLTEEQKEQINDNIIDAIKKLGRFQTGNGGFAYWPGSTVANDYGSSYAGHFLLLAKENGYFVSSEMINDWINYQRKVANNWEPNYYNNNIFNDLNQAYRLYTLAVAGKPNVQAMNRLMETEGLSMPARYRLAAAYAVMGRKGAAKKLLNKKGELPAEDSFYYYDNFGSHLRDYALMLETQYLLGDHEKAAILFDKIAAQLGSDIWLSTQSTALGLYAVSLYAGNYNNGSELKFRWKWQGKSTETQSDKPVITIPLDAKEGKLNIKNLTENDIFITITTSEIPYAGQMVNIEKNLKTKIVYRDMNNKIINIDEIKQGKDFYAEITVSNSGFIGNYKHMALSFAVPSGWEIINTRMWKAGENLSSDKPEYLDIKDDRVNIFFDLNVKRSKKFIILLNAAYPGTFFVPNTTCEEMYNHSIMTVSGGGKTEVVR